MGNFRMNSQGKYVYDGETFTFVDQGISRKRAMLYFWLLVLGMIGGVIAVGCLPAAGMVDAFYVIFAYVAEIVALISVVWAMCRLAAGGDPLWDYVYWQSVEKFKFRSLLLAIFDGACVILEIFYLIVNGFGGRVAATIVFFVIQAALAGLVYLMRVLLSKLKWKGSKKKIESVKKTYRKKH